MRVADHLVDTLQTLNVEPSLIDEIMAQVATLAPDIVNTSSPVVEETQRGKDEMMKAVPTEVTEQAPALLLTNGASLKPVIQQ